MAEFDIKACLLKANFSPEIADRAEKIYKDRLEAKKDVNAARKATAKAMKQEAEELEKIGAMDIVTQDKLMTWVKESVDMYGKADAVRILRDIYSNRFGGQKFHDIEFLQESILQIEVAPLAQFIHEMRSGVLSGGLRRKGTMIKFSGQDATQLGDAVRMVAMHTPKDKMKGIKPEILELAEEVVAMHNQVRESIIKQLQDQGSNIKLLKSRNYGLSQTLQAEKVTELGEEGFIKLMFDTLDRNLMIDQRSMQPMSDAELTRMLKYSYEDIATGGWKHRAAEARTGKREAYDIYGDHRFFHYKDADAHKKIGETLGSSDVYENMIGSLHDLTRTLAHMKTFGPRPEKNRLFLNNHILKLANEGKLTIDNAENLLKPLHDEMKGIQKLYKPTSKQTFGDIAKLQKEIVELRRKTTSLKTGQQSKPLAAAEDRLNKLYDDLEANHLPKDPAEQVAALEAMRRVKDDFLITQFQAPRRLQKGMSEAQRRAAKVAEVEREIDRADNLWKEVSGVGYDMTRTANAQQVARNLTVAGLLGGATLSALTDFAHIFGRGFYNSGGMGIASPARIMARQMKQLFSGKNARVEALQMGLGFDRMLDSIKINTKWGEIDTKGASGLLASGVLSSSGLLRWTEAGKRAVAQEFMTRFAQNADKAFDKLPRELRQMMERHTITAKDWDIIRAAPKHKINGIDFDTMINAVDVARVNKDVGYRYRMMIRREQIQAVPEVDARYRAGVRGIAGEGEGGHLIKTLTLFKSFPVVTAVNIHRQFQQGLAERGVSGPLLQLLAVIGGAYIFGNLSLWAKDLAAGKRPDFSEDSIFGSSDVGGAFFSRGLKLIGHASGAGLFADLVRLGENNRGGWKQGVADFVGGPVFGNTFQVADPLYKAVKGEIFEDFKGGKGQWQKVIQKGSKWVPGNSHWVARPFFEKGVNALRYWADPVGAEKTSKGQRSWAKKQNQQFFEWRDPKNFNQILPF